MTNIPASVTGETTIREAAPGVQAVDVEAVNAKESRQLYASRTAIYPKRASGKFRTIKWLVMAATLSIYYILPWIRWDRGTPWFWRCHPGSWATLRGGRS